MGDGISDNESDIDGSAAMDNEVYCGVEPNIDEPATGLGFPQMPI